MTALAGLALIRRSFGQSIRLLTSILGVLMLFQFVLIAVAGSYFDSGGFAVLANFTPEFFQATFGGAFASFAGMTTLGYFDPLVVMMAAECSIYLATEPAGEIESGLFDLVLARALPRHWIITRSWCAMTLNVAAMVSAMALGTWLGLVFLAPAGAPWPTPRTVEMLMAHLAALAWALGSAGLAAATFAKRRGQAIGVVSIVAFACYLIEIVGGSWKPAKALSRLSPFHYYQGAAILAGTSNPVRDLSILFAIGVAGIAIAYWQFQRRDL